MKTAYTKPLLAVELFGVMQTGARDCSDSIPKEQVTSSDITTCYWDLGGGAKVFLVDKVCNIDGENMGFACYNNPSEDSLIFRS